MDVQIIYTSRTGNTEKLAEAVFAAVPVKEKNVKRIEERTERDDGDLYLVGFWTDRGTAGSEILDLLGSLHGKKVALFGTCGMGNDPQYYKRILNGVAAFIPEDSEYLGGFLCQGKMPIQVRQRYESMRGVSDTEQIDRMIRNFDEALLHPDRKDLKAASDFVKSLFGKIKRSKNKCHAHTGTKQDSIQRIYL